jgi:hypothetical protein
VRKTVFGAALILGLTASLSTAWAYDVNKDIKNLGPNAYDVAVVLPGLHTGITTFNGYPPGSCRTAGQFSSVSNGPVGGNTEIHWQNFNDGSGNVIKTNKIIHVGWSSNDHSTSIQDMYWTDASGKRIPGSVLYNITTGWTYNQTTNVVLLNWQHIFRTNAPITLQNISFAVLPQAFPLAQLNPCNTVLAAQLRALSTGFTLAPGETRSISLPATVPPGSAVVVSYDVVGSGNSGESTDFIQFLAESTATPQ